MLVLPFKEEEAPSGDWITASNEESVKKDTFATTSNGEKLVWVVHACIDFLSSGKLNEMCCNQC